MDSPKPKRRWFRFSLRTMFVVVTVACVWLAWEVDQIRERKEVMRLLNQRQLNLGSEEPTDPSWRLRYLGDADLAIVGFKKNEEASLHDLLVRTKAAFPRVKFWQFVDQGHDSWSLEQYYGDDGEFKIEP